MPDMDDVVEQIMAREPLFHHRELVHSAETFDDEASNDFWEVGASGQVYSRNDVRSVVLQRLATGKEDEMSAEGCRLEDPRARELGDDTFLFTYVLRGQGRVTRRSTIWRHDDKRGWHALYHQGTAVHPTPGSTSRG
jgi:hypothetical protein